MGADAVRKKLGDSSIKFYETNIKMSQSNFVNIECGFRPKYFIYTILFSGNITAAFFVNIDEGMEICILGNNNYGSINVPSNDVIPIIYEVYDTGIRLKASRNIHAQNTAYFYIFG